MADKTPHIDSKYILNRQGRDMILYAGLLDAAHNQFGLRAITTTLVQVPSDLNKHVAIVHATVETEGGTFSGLGDASPENVSRNILPHTIRMAETRAKARALRDAINAAEFVLDDDPPAEVDRETGEITRPTLSRPPHAESVSDALKKIDRGDLTAAARTSSGSGLKDIQNRWTALVEECEEAGFTKDLEEANQTGKPHIPTLTDEQFANATELIGQGRALKDRLSRFKEQGGSGA
jgi:hypothetical protein